jgi:hypothetical protein
LPDGINRQRVRQIFAAVQKAEAEADQVKKARGRPPYLSEVVQARLVRFLAVLVATKTVAFTAVLLQPLAIGYLAASGFPGVMTAESVRGVFSCSLSYIKRLLPKHKWKSLKPSGDSVKLPTDWLALGHDMVLRLAYFVFLYRVPPELVINGDHTGVYQTPLKGKHWITPEMAAEGENAVKGLGSKQQFTVLGASAASGHLLKSQVVMVGKGRNSLPFRGKGLFILAAVMGGAATVQNGCKKSHPTACFTVDPRLAALSSDEGPINLEGIGSWCVTSNHWSDDITSIAWLDDILAPYVKATIV